MSKYDIFSCLFSISKFFAKVLIFIQLSKGKISFYSMIASGCIIEYAIEINQSFLLS